MEQKQFTESALWGLSPEWRIRPNYDRAIVYRFNTEEIKWYLINLSEGLMMSLLNGQRNIGQTIIEFSELFGIDEQTSTDIWTSIERYPWTKDETVLVELNSKNHQITETNTRSFLQLSHATNPDTKLGYFRLELPISLLLMPSNNCTRDCIYCYAERQTIPRREHLTVDRWLELIDEAALNGIDIISFSGGDPLTYLGIFDLVERLCQWETAFVLPTKKLVTREEAERLASFNPKHGQFQVSIDGVNASIVDQMMGVNGSSVELFQTLENLLRAGLYVRVNMVVTPFNLGQVEELATILYSMGVKRMNITNYGRSFYRHQNSLFLSVDQIAQLQERINRLKQELEWEELISNVSIIDYSMNADRSNQEDNWKSRAHCSAGRSCMTIAANGNVILCEQAPQYPPFILGNVRESSLTETWNSLGSREIIVPPKELFQGTACYDCSEFEECVYGPGYCARDSYFVYSSPFHPSPNCPKAPPGWRMG